MAKYLVIFKDQVDDIDVNGFKVMSERDLTDFENLAETINWGFSYPIGETKLHFVDGEDLLTKLEYKEITNEESKLLTKFFNGGFGIFIDEDFLKAIDNEDLDLDVDDEDDLDLFRGDDEEDY